MPRDGAGLDYASDPSGPAAARGRTSTGPTSHSYGEDMGVIPPPVGTGSRRRQMVDTQKHDGRGTAALLATHGLG